MYCPNCGANLPDDAEFCRNCGAKVKRDSVGLQNTGPQMAASAEKTKKRLAPGWIVLIALVCVAVILAAVMIPIYAKAPVLPVSSSTSDGKSKFTYSFDKKTGELKIEGTLSANEDSDSENISPFIRTEWLIALSKTSDPYKAQSLQLCTIDANAIPDTLSEYVMGNNEYIADGTIQKVDYSFENLKDGTVSEYATYEFKTSNDRVTQVKVNASGLHAETTTYFYTYDDQGRIIGIWDENHEYGGNYEYDENGVFKSYQGENTLGISAENDGQHVTHIQANIGAATGSEAAYQFDGQTLRKVDTDEGGGWAGGGYHISNSSQFVYKNNYVSRIVSVIDSKGEDASSSSGNYHYHSKISIVFEYKKML